MIPFRDACIQNENGGAIFILNRGCGFHAKMPEVLQRCPDFVTELSGREPTFASYTRYVATGWSPRFEGQSPRGMNRCDGVHHGGGSGREAPRKKDSLSHLSAKSHEVETHPLFHPPSCRIDPGVYLLAPYEDTSRGKKGFRRERRDAPPEPARRQV